jgi:hypothetical protein
MRFRNALIILWLATAAAAQSVPPNFTIDLVPVDSSKLPALHSFAAARGSDGKWLVAGGRTNGLHLFVQSTDGGTTAPPNAFAPASANNKLWVIDPVARTSWSAPLTGLPQNVIDALSATNAEATQSGNTLYVIGGYGWSTAQQQMLTFPTVTAIDVDATIAAIVGGNSFASSIQQTSTWYDCVTPGVGLVNQCIGNINCAPGPDFQQCGQQATQQCYQQQAQANAQCITQVQSGQTTGLTTNAGTYVTVAGGGLEKLGNSYYLIFGHNFTGMYSVSPGDYGKWPVNQVYTKSVFALWLQANPLAGAVLLQVQQDPNDLSAPYNRRDLNVLPGLAADGTPMIQVLGGVFVPGQDSAYRQPIFITSKSASSMNIALQAYQQSMSQYDCAVIPLYTRASGGGTLTNVMLGGISLYYVDEKTGKLKVDSGLPFISAISALTLQPNGTWSEYYRVAPIAIGGKSVRVGADAKFMRNPAVAAAPNGVLYLDSVKKRTLVGWMYGGMIADAPNPGASNKGTAASSQLFEIWIDPATPLLTYWVTTANAPQVTITPNNDTAKR